MGQLANLGSPGKWPLKGQMYSSSDDQGCTAVSC